MDAQIDVLLVEDRLSPCRCHRLELRLDQVHLRRADEARDEHVGGLGEDLVRRRDLLDQAVAHDGDAVGHGQGLELVVGDDDGRLGEA